MKHLVFLFFFGSLLQTLAQNEANVWYFGYGCGLDFNRGYAVPVPRRDTRLIDTLFFFSGTSVCDTNGNLLFHSNGYHVWNGRDELMPNGRRITNYVSTPQQVAVPWPGQRNRYLVFTAPSSPRLEARLPLTYSVVDMTRDSGSGDVVEKNVSVFVGSTATVAATRHANGRDYWVVAHEFGNNAFRAYRVTGDGLDTRPVVTRIGSSHTTVDSLQGGIVGQMKISPDGTKLAVGVGSGSPILELFDFDAATGRLSGFVPLFRGRIFNDVVFGLDFSPNGRLLYASRLLNLGTTSGEAIGELCQYDLDARSGALVLARKGGLLYAAYGQMQLAPDGKVYVGSFDADLTPGPARLGVIHHPNRPGTACDFQPDGIRLLCNVKQGLPGFVSSFLLPRNRVAFEMPNVITPNGDGLNDRFLPIRMEGIERASLRVYNRWGKQVFSAEDILNGWDGGSLSNGTYYWMASYRTEDGRQGNQKGWVEVLR